jgi:hypothetical protein
MTTEPEEIGELTRTARDLVDRIDRLVGDTDSHMISLSQQAVKNRHFMMILGVITAFIVALVVVMGVSLTALSDLTNKVNSQQETTRSKVLCPLYQQFVNADTPRARELAKAAGQDLALRDSAFAAIHKSYIVLGCSG